MKRSDWKAVVRNMEEGLRSRVSTPDPDSEAPAPTVDPRLKGAELKYGGRTLELQIFINTDEDIHAVAERLREPAAGPELRMVAILGREVEPELAEKLWASTWDAVVETRRRQS